MISTVTDPLLRDTSYQYNNHGQVTRTTYAVGTPDQASTSSTYDPLTDDLISQTDELGNVTTYTYDNLGRPKTVTEPADAAGNYPATQYEYDATGRVTRVTDPVGHITDHVYDDALRQETIYQRVPDGGTMLTWSTVVNAYTRTDQLYEVTDARGGKTTYGYDVLGRTTSITQPAPDPTHPNDNRPQTSWTLDALNRVTTKTDPLTKVTSIAYVNSGNMVTVTLPIEISPGVFLEMTYEYNSLGQLWKEWDNTTTPPRHWYHRYDDLGNPDKMPLSSDPEGDGVAGNTYDKVGNIIANTCFCGYTTDYTYDNRNRLIEKISPDPDDFTAREGTNGPLVRLIDRYSYDAAGRPTAEVDPLGLVTNHVYDALGRVIEDHSGQVIDNQDDGAAGENLNDDQGYAETGSWSNNPSGGYDGNYHTVATAATATATAAWTFEHLIPGRPYQLFVTWEAPTGNSNANNAPFSVHDGTVTGTTLGAFPLDQSHVPGYSGMTCVVLGGQKFVRLGTVSSYTFTPTGSELTVELTNQAQSGKQVVADGAYLLSATSDMSYTYCLLGKITNQTDALGHTTHYDYSYNTTGFHKTVTDAAGSTQYQYDAAGNLVSLTDAAGNTTTWVYDGLNRMKTETDTTHPLHSRHYEYDARGGLKKYTDRDDRVTEYDYDDIGRRTDEKWLDSDGVTVLHEIDYTYDATGNMHTATDQELIDGTLTDQSQYTYGVDALGGATSIDMTIVGLDATVRMEYGFWSSGRVNEAKAIVDGVTKYDAAYSYDRTGRLTTIQWNLSEGVARTTPEYKAAFGYDDADRLSSVERYDATQLVAASGYAYDWRSQLLALTHVSGTGSPAPVLAGYAWAYDSAGRVSGYSYTSETTPAWNQSSTYSYDNTNQLLGASGTSSEAYTYDATGNRLTANGQTYQTDDPNRLHSDGAYTYEYDNEGNRTQRTKIADGSVTEYVWDYRNRLEAVVEKEIVAGTLTDTKITKYLYDAFDKLIGKDVDNGANGTLDHRERYVYDGDNVVLEFEDSGSGDLTATDLKQRYLCGPAVDAVFGEVSPIPGGGDGAFWYLKDNLGSVRDVARYDGSSTTVVDHLIYDSFGNFTETNSAYQPRTKFAGYVWDADAGLYYCRNRWYDAKVGRFLSEDPIRFAGGDPNLQRYVGNSPTNFTDPTGLRGLMPPGPIGPWPTPGPSPPPTEGRPPGWYVGSPYCIGYRCGCSGPTLDDWFAGGGGSGGGGIGGGWDGSGGLPGGGQMMQPLAQNAPGAPAGSSGYHNGWFEWGMPSWGDYWYYLTHPFQQDKDIIIGQGVCLAVSAGAAGAATGIVAGDAIIITLAGVPTMVYVEGSGAATTVATALALKYPNAWIWVTEAIDPAWGSSAASACGQVVNRAWNWLFD